MHSCHICLHSYIINILTLVRQKNKSCIERCSTVIIAIANVFVDTATLDTVIRVPRLYVFHQETLIPLKNTSHAYQLNFYKLHNQFLT